MPIAFSDSVKAVHDVDADATHCHVLLVASITNEAGRPSRDAVILASDDGGRHFERRHLLVDGDISQIAWTEGEVVWAIGSAPGIPPNPTRPLVLRSLDNGRTWEEVPVPLGGLGRWQLLDVLVRGNEAWVTGHGSAPEPHNFALVTDDAGVHWRLAFELPNERNVGVALAGDSVLLAHGGGTASAAYVSDDAGASFQKVLLRLGIVGAVGTTVLVDPLIGFVGGYRKSAPSQIETTPVLLRTADGGRTWTEVEILGRGSAAYLRFTSPTVGYAFRIDQTPFQEVSTVGAWLLSTSDAGQTWIEEPRRVFVGGEWSLFIGSDQTFWGYLSDQDSPRFLVRVLG